MIGFDRIGISNSGIARCIGVMCVFLAALPFLGAGEAWAQGTAAGEIEERAAPVGRRYCLGGTSAGDLCNEDSDCPGSSCTDTNVFNLSVAVHFDASAVELTAIENLLSDGSAAIFDATDGQAEFGQATIHNDTFGSIEADLRIYAQTCSTGTSLGTACTTDANCPPNTGTARGECGVWWWAMTGSWNNNDSMHVSIDNILTAGAGGGASLAHEFVHLVFDARDEYQTRAGCGGTAGLSGTAECPHSGSGGPPCLMDTGDDELCWGQADSSDVTDLFGGNHDPSNTTEQSECRNDRSCWDQVVWSWPSVFLKPTGAPDPAANGDVVADTHFVHTSDEVRVVLVLDESGSMDNESPMRMERLKVAAKDFIALAENDAEVGIVSYSDDADPANGRANVPIDALSSNRAACNAAINGLNPDNRTNIGDGLEEAKQMIVDAGGVTANTFVVLMTDGRNNEPWPQATADADLDAWVDDLMISGIPVYVTCTGSDPGLESQCSEVADGTGGFYVDSADAARLPEAFAEYHEKITGHEAIGSMEGHFAKLPDDGEKKFFVDAGSEAVSFTLQWRDAAADASMSVTDPGGTVYPSIPMPQGRFVRVKGPTAGDWTMQIDPAGSQGSWFVARAFTRHRSSNLKATARYPSVLPGEEIWIYAYPQAFGRSITHPTAVITATVTLPDGSKDTLELHDGGRDASGRGDDIPGDGMFTGIYRNTTDEGSYEFLIAADMEGWSLSEEDHTSQSNTITSGRFVREVRLSAAVGDAKQPVPDPEDGPPGSDPGSRLDCCTVVTLLILVLLLLTLYVVWRCCCSKRMAKLPS